jgi:hypothetical protein
MLLQSLLQHRKNTGVLVNGHQYWIGADLVVRSDKAGAPVDVPAADAQKLMTNPKAWAPFDPTKQSEKPAPRAGAERPRISLISNNGDVIPPPPPSSSTPDATKPAMEVSAVMAAQDAFEAKKAGELPAPTEVADPPIPTGDGEWADPDIRFSFNWLQLCAKAYKIKYKGKDKSVLVEKIKAAMYG